MGKKLEKYKVIDFTVQSSSKDDIELVIPTGTTIKEYKVYPDGVYAWVETSAIEVQTSETYYLKVVLPQQEIPNGYEFITVLDFPTERGIGLIPLYIKK